MIDDNLDIRHWETQGKLWSGDVTPRHIAADIMPSEIKESYVMQSMARKEVLVYFTEQYVKM